MEPQVAKLFSNEYKIDEAEYSKLMNNFFEHPHQKGRSFRLVATEKKIVIGYVSFFYWPYCFKNKTYNSFQCGNVLVHPDYRGKGVFKKILGLLDTHKDDFKIDFLVTFPIDASVGGFLRNNWKNTFNLNWRIKVINPLSLLFPLNIIKLKKYFPNKNLFIQNNSVSDFIKLSNTKEFYDWRSINNVNEKYYSFHFTENGNELLLKLKINIRKKIIKELIIGDIITTTYDPSFIKNALTVFLKTIKKVKCITLISIAINEESDNCLNSELSDLGFKKINKKINMLTTHFSNCPFIENNAKWIAYRSDLDTW